MRASCLNILNSLGSNEQTNDAKKDDIETEIIGLKVDDGDDHTETHDKEEQENGQTGIEHSAGGIRRRGRRFEEGQSSQDSLASR